MTKNIYYDFYVYVLLLRFDILSNMWYINKDRRGNDNLLYILLSLAVKMFTGFYNSIL